MTAQLSKERLEEIRDYDTCVTLEESAEMARRLLAVEGQEPVGVVRAVNAPGEMTGLHVSLFEKLPVGTEVYAAPPAPVAQPVQVQVQVQPEQYQHLSELYHAQEKRLFKIAQRIKGPSFDKYAHSPSQAIDVLESAIFGESNDACRAAMLQPSQWIPCSERMPEKYDSGIWLWDGEDVSHGYVWDGSEFSDWNENYLVLNNVSHWMPIIFPSAPQEPTK